MQAKSVLLTAILLVHISPWLGGSRTKRKNRRYNKRYGKHEQIPRHQLDGEYNLCLQGEHSVSYAYCLGLYGRCPARRWTAIVQVKYTCVLQSSLLVPHHFIHIGNFRGSLRVLNQSQVSRKTDDI